MSAGRWVLYTGMMGVYLLMTWAAIGAVLSFANHFAMFNEFPVLPVRVTATVFIIEIAILVPSMGVYSIWWLDQRWRNG